MKSSWTRAFLIAALLAVGGASLVVAAPPLFNGTVIIPATAYLQLSNGAAVSQYTCTDTTHKIVTTPCPTFAAGATPTPFPSVTALAAGGQQMLCVTNVGALTVGGTCTPTPAPTVTSANANCTITAFVLTCVTPSPLATAMHAEIVMTLPTTSASTGATTFPVPLQPSWKNLQATGAASSCATAGTGTPETFIFLQSTSTQGVYASAVPTTFVLATGNAPGVVETIVATTFATPVPNGGFIVAKVQAQNGSTTRTGICTYTLFFDWTP